MNIVVNYGISKSPNEYCGTLSNGFVLNYRMNISNLLNGYWSKLSNEYLNLSKDIAEIV